MSGIGKALGGLFGGGPSAPAPAPAPPAPTTDDAAKRQADEAARMERSRRVGGAGSNILTSPLGDTSTASIGRKTLLGQ